MEQLRFTCPGLEDGGRFPIRYTGRGEDRAPDRYPAGFPKADGWKTALVRESLTASIAMPDPNPRP